MSQLELGMELTSVLSHFSYSSVLESTWRFLLPLGGLDPLTHHKVNSLIQVSFLEDSKAMTHYATCPNSPNAGGLCSTCFATQVHHGAVVFQRRSLVEHLL